MEPRDQMREAVRVEILSIVLGVFASVIVSASLRLVLRWLHPMPDNATPSLEERVRKLGNALASSARAIDEIEGEVQARQQLVASLEADAKRYETLRALHRDEVDAIAQLVRGEMRAEGNRLSRRQFWLGVLQNAIFFAGGVVVTLSFA